MTKKSPPWRQDWPEDFPPEPGEGRSGPVDQGLPRHLRIALARATDAFLNDDASGLGTFNEDLQPLIDAAIAWGRRGAKMRPALDATTFARLADEGRQGARKLRDDSADMRARCMHGHLGQCPVCG